MIEEIPFPEQEYESIQNYLNKLGYCYTTRVYKEIGKYKVGELYTAPWGDVLKIDEVKTYWKVSDRPFRDDFPAHGLGKGDGKLGLPYRCGAGKNDQRRFFIKIYFVLIHRALD